MATYYDVTLRWGIPHGSDILNKPCSVTFTYPDGSHSQAYAGTVLAWFQQNVIRMSSNYMNIEAAWGGANGGTLSIGVNGSTLNVPITEFAKNTRMEMTMAEALTNYAVNISMPQATVEALSQNNFILYGFKAVKTTAKGAPLVWFQTTQFGLSTVVSWSEQYQAYTSTSHIIPNGEIIASNSYPISLDNTLNVTGGTGTGTVDTTTGTPGAISINNQTTTQFTCGISQTQPNGSVTSMCAFPLFGGMLDVIAPIEQVLLMFSTTPVNTGTVIEQSYSAGVFIDLTGEPSRTVNFDINAGWSWDGGPWAKSIPANSNLVPLMIQSSPALVKNRLMALHRSASFVA